MSNETKTKAVAASLLIGLCVVVAYTSFLAIHYKREAALRSLALKGSFERETEYASTLFHLAGERFAAHEQRGETWIFSTHAPTYPLRKFTDGRFTVVSVPTNGYTGAGFELYAAHYNDFVLHKADLLALGGQYEDALVVYQLVLQYDSAGVAAPYLRKRIALIEQLTRGHNQKASKKALEELIGNGEPVPSEFQQVETMRALRVTNLFTCF